MNKEKLPWSHCKMMGRFLAWAIVNNYKSEQGQVWSKSGIEYNTSQLFDIYWENKVMARRERMAMSVYISGIALNFYWLVFSPAGILGLLNVGAMVFNAYLIDKTIKRRKQRRGSMRK